MTAVDQVGTNYNTSKSPTLVQTVNVAGLARLSATQSAAPGGGVPDSGSFTASLPQINVGPIVTSQPAAAAPDATILLTV